MFRRRREGYLWILGRLKKKHPIDAARVYFEGFSMGGSFGAAWCYGLYKSNPEGFPFRAMIYNSGCFTPVKEEYAPRVPHLFFAGTEGETEQAINRESRMAFNSLFRMKREVRFHQMQGMGHKINADVRRIIHDFIAADGPKPEIFERMWWLDSQSKELARRIEGGEWEEGWRILLERMGDGKLTPKERSNALKMKTRLERHVNEELARLKKKVEDKTLTFAEYRVLRQVADSLPGTDMAKHARSMLAGKRKFEAFAREYEAFLLFHEAWDLEIEAPERGKAAFQDLGKSFPDTEYGGRARERLLALGD
jgi:hypothetical protein